MRTSSPVFYTEAPKSYSFAGLSQIFIQNSKVYQSDVYLNPSPFSSTCIFVTGVLIPEAMGHFFQKPGPNQGIVPVDPEFMSLHLCHVLNTVLKKGVLENNRLCVPICLFSRMEKR